MSEPIHDDEPDTSESVVRALLRTELPAWAESPLEYVKASGTDNAMWRLSIDGGADVVVRLPRRPDAVDGVLAEVSVLEQVRKARLGQVVQTPKVRHVGHPHERFPHHWSVLEWIDGTDAWTARRDLDGRNLSGLAAGLAAAVVAISTCEVEGVRERGAGERGGPLGPLLERLDWWLNSPEWNAANLMDVGAVGRLASAALEAIDEPVVHGFVHGDLIAGNLLVDEGRLRAIIDWGGAGRGDTAQDLAPAWAVLTPAERSVFKDAVDADDAAWMRGRVFELAHAVSGVLYYTPRRHPLGDVMSRTLNRILASP